MIEIIATNGNVLTQSYEVADGERIYVHRVFTHDATLWKEVSESEMPKIEENECI